MNLKLVEPGPDLTALAARMNVRCIDCGAWVRIGDGVYADLDGKSFEAYYCPADAEKRIALNSESAVIEPGDTVRSYDFPYRNDLGGNRSVCFVEGVVEEICPRFNSCDRYKIKVTRRVFNGVEFDPREWRSEFVEGVTYPPVNGTPSTMGGVTNGVVLLSKGNK